MLKPILVVLILLSLFFIGLNTVQADNDFSGQIKDVFSKTTGEAGYKTDVEVASLAGTIIKSIVALVGVAFLVLMIYGGILWLTAGGMEEQVSKSQKTISRAVIGFIIVLAAYGLTDYTVGKIITATGVDVKVKS